MDKASLSLTIKNLAVAIGAITGTVAVLSVTIGDYVSEQFIKHHQVLTLDNHELFYQSLDHALKSDDISKGVVALRKVINATDTIVKNLLTKEVDKIKAYEKTEPPDILYAPRAANIDTALQFCSNGFGRTEEIKCDIIIEYAMNDGAMIK